MIEARSMERVKLSAKSLLEDKIVLGLTNPEQAAKYGISQAQLVMAQKMAGIEGIRPVKVSFELDMDLTEQDKLQVSIIRGEDKEAKDEEVVVKNPYKEIEAITPLEAAIEMVENAHTAIVEVVEVDPSELTFIDSPVQENLV